MVKIGIIGGGISGLATGHNLANLLDNEEVKYTIDVLEKEKNPGGTIRSIRKKGFTVESGPNGFLDSKPWTLELCDSLGLTEKLYLADNSAKRRYIFYKGKLIRVPTNPPQFLKSRLMSLKGKMRLGMEIFIPRGKPDVDETIAEFGTRRIGREAVENMLDPMVTGVFAGDPYKMSLKACFPRIWEMEQEHGALTKALIHIARRRKTSGPAGPGGTLTSFEKGTQFLVDTLTKDKRLNVKTGTGIKKIEKTKTGWKVNGKTYDVVIMAIPTPVSAELLESTDEKLAEKMRSIPYSPMAVFGMGFKKEITTPNIDGFGFLIPNKEGRKILGCLFSSNIFPNRAPEDYDLLQVMMGGARNKGIRDMSDKKMKELAVSEIKDILNLKGDPDFVQTVKWDNAIPQYLRGHLKLVEQIESKVKKQKGLFVTGNAYYGIGVNDCTRSAMETAEKVRMHIVRDKK